MPGSCTKPTVIMPFTVGIIAARSDARTISDNEDIKEFYLGLTGVGQRKSYRDVKHYRRRKRWLS